MKKISLVFALLPTLFFSCTQQPKDVAMSDEMKNPEEVIKPFFADNYPVTDQMLGKGSANRATKTAHLIYENTAWFTNDSLKQTLMFVLFSDNTRLVTICFDNNDVPVELMARVTLLMSGQILRQTKTNCAILMNFLRRQKG